MCPTVKCYRSYVGLHSKFECVSKNQSRRQWSFCLTCKCGHFSPRPERSQRFLFRSSIGIVVMVLQNDVSKWFSDDLA